MSVAEYVRTVQEEAKLGVPETSHYPALKNLLNAAGDELAPKVRVLIHPKGSSAGIPDGELWTASRMPKPGQQALDMFGPEAKIADRGGLEVKGLDEDLGKLVASDQVRKYLGRYRQLLLTNLREFAVVQFRDGAPTLIERHALAETPAAFLALTEKQARAAERPMKEFLRRALSGLTEMSAPGEVAFFLASHAREARDRLDQFENPLELESLKGALESALGIQFGGSAGDAFFRAELVQTLFYGLFSAWVLWHEQEPGRKDVFHYGLTSSYLAVPVIDRLYNATASYRLLEQTKLVHSLRNAADVLNRVRRDAFFQAFQAGEAVPYFYEPFLAAFDPELRKQLGVWYTPPEIVKGMVAKCDRLLMEELGEPDGLAGEGVLVLDPCCGTGAFIVEALRVAAERWKARGEPYADRLRKAATQRMFGFELLTGPFVVAHLQVAVLLAKHGVRLKGVERAAVYLTNALTGWEPADPAKRALDPLALHAESERAHEVKRERDILVVIGNPPYSGYAGISKMEEERELSDRYRPERSRGQGLNDLYVRFFAMADRRIQNTGRGLVCLISNYSWLEGLSFAKMRQTLLGQYDRIWIDNLHGDKYATGKLTPEGEPDPSVFSTEKNKEGIQVGTAVATLLRLGRGPRERQAEVSYRDYWGTTKRLDFLRGVGEYRSLTPVAQLGYPLRPRAVEASYLAWPRLPELFPMSTPGVKTSRDGALVSIDIDPLRRRMGLYFDPNVSDEQVRAIAPDLLDTTKRFPAQHMRRLMVVAGIESGFFCRFHYQPFDDRWIFYHPSKLLDERRPDHFALASRGNLFILSRAKGERILEGAPAGLTRHLTDWHATRPGSACFPLYLAAARAMPGDQASLLDDEPAQDDRAVPNLSERAWEVLRQAGLETAPETLFFHALATLHAPAYAAENAGALRQDWPRVPTAPTDGEPAEWLSQGARLGRRVAALLDIETAVPGIDAGDPDPSLSSIARFEMADGSQPRERTEDVAVKMRWGYRGQGGVVMPGPDSSWELLGEGVRVVPANPRARWTGVPEAVWNYHLGGYQVLKKWLSYREESTLGRPLTFEEVRTFTSICRRIASLLALGPQLDAHYRRAR